MTGGSKRKFNDLESSTSCGTSTKSSSPSNSKLSNLSRNWQCYVNGKSPLNGNQIDITSYIDTRSRKETVEKAEVLARPKLRNLLEKKKLVAKKRPSSCKNMVAMDCEMVEVSDGSSVLARVSLVDSECNVLYDTFVKAREEVTDYRTHVSGVQERDMEHGKPFEVAQKEVADLLKDKILVGHALRNDLNVLYLSHPKTRIRDTAKYKPFRRMVGGRTPGLKALAKLILGIVIQEGEHDSTIDAGTAMKIYCTHQETWEKELSKKSKVRSTSAPNKSDGVDTTIASLRRGRKNQAHKRYRTNLKKNVNKKKYVL